MKRLIGVFYVTLLVIFLAFLTGCHGDNGGSPTNPVVEAVDEWNCDDNLCYRLINDGAQVEIVRRVDCYWDMATQTAVPVNGTETLHWLVAAVWEWPSMRNLANVLDFCCGEDDILVISALEVREYDDYSEFWTRFVFDNPTHYSVYLKVRMRINGVINEPFVPPEQLKWICEVASALAFPDSEENPASELILSRTEIEIVPPDAERAVPVGCRHD